MARLIALLILVIPGALAAVGVKLMRDTVFDVINSPFPSLWLQFLSGLIIFVAGITFIGGWIFYRDRKRHYVADRYQKRPAERNRKQ